MQVIFSFKSNSVFHITGTPYVFWRHLCPSLTHIGGGGNKNFTHIFIEPDLASKQEKFLQNIKKK